MTTSSVACRKSSQRRPGESVHRSQLNPRSAQLTAIAWRSGSAIVNPPLSISLVIMVEPVVLSRVLRVQGPERVGARSMAEGHLLALLTRSRLTQDSGEVWLLS